MRTSVQGCQIAGLSQASGSLEHNICLSVHRFPPSLRPPDPRHHFSQESLFEEAHLLRDRELDLKLKLSGVAAAAPVVPLVGVAEIEHIVSAWTKIPVDRLSQEDSERLMRLQDVLTVRLLSSQV